MITWNAHIAYVPTGQHLHVMSSTSSVALTWYLAVCNVTRENKSSVTCLVAYVSGSRMAFPSMSAGNSVWQLLVERPRKGSLAVVCREKGNGVGPACRRSQCSASPRASASST
eukprot:1456470-Rhodomonas_salina.1